MPSLGADMDEGKLVEWKVKAGDTVNRGDVVAVVETKKADIEIEIWEPGVVGELLIEPGVTVPVGTPIARLNGAAPSVLPPPAAAGAEGGVEAMVLPPPAGGGTVGGNAVRVRVSPLARTIAQKLGVDLGSVTGTGPGGAITRVDVESAARAPMPPTEPPPAGGGRTLEAAAPPTLDAPQPPTEPPPAGGGRTASEARQLAMREAIAALMAKSKQEIPHYYLGSHIDLTRALTWLESENRGRSVAKRILYSALLIKAVALAIHDVPEMNGFFIGGEFHPEKAVHVGVAISLRQGGLIAPALHNADTLGLDEIMAGMRDLVNRARAGVLRSSEMSDPTITVTNLGEQGVETVYGVIYTPQVALVGFGKVIEQPYAEGGLLGVRRMVHVTLSADHRVSDGHRGGLFLAAIDQHLQEPEKL